MTLIVWIKTKDSIILAADGMGYTHGDAKADVPYETPKLRLANSAWVIGFAGWGGIEVQYAALETEIRERKRSFDPDITAGGYEYIARLKNLAPANQSWQLSLAGFDSVGSPHVIEAISPDLSPYFPASISACGVQKTSAIQILRMFSGCCESNRDFRDLASFSIWLAASNDLKIGKMEDGYPVSTCILTAGCLPTIEQLKITPTLARMNDGLKSLQDAFSSFLSTPRIATSKTSKAR